LELLLAVSRERPGTLRSQVENDLRTAVRDGSLRAGVALPSTRDLAAQLGVSRKVIVDAYAQLAAEGYLTMRQGVRPTVASGRSRPAAAPGEVTASETIRFDFRPSRPDVSAFPRETWARCLREAMGEITTEELGYGDPLGVPALRTVLADHLGRTRGIVAAPGATVITGGYLHGLGLIAHALRARGARTVAIEHPGNPEQAAIVGRAGLTAVRVPVDELGVRVSDLKNADAVVLTPAHQHPTGVVLAPSRRAELVTWLRDRQALAIEDDYDAEYRYDRPAVGALQGLDPAHVVYCGTTSKVLAPALRLGWLVAPPWLAAALRTGPDLGSPRIEQLAFAKFVERGDLDRHLRRMRLSYRRRRDAMVSALAAAMPEAEVQGIAAGLHVTVTLPATVDRATLLRAARSRGIALATMADYDAATDRPTLVLGYSQMSEDRIAAGITELAACRG
jgi:GntR family transcriptional regulator/MocR family aminotransferase